MQQPPLFYRSKLLSVTLCAVLASCSAVPVSPVVSAVAAPAASAQVTDTALEPLAEKDGWGAFEGGVWGGGDAKAENIYVASNRAQLMLALAAGDATGQSSTPKIVYIRGTIDMAVDANNQSVGAAYFSDPAYSFAEYTKAYDPAKWGKNPAAGAQEQARIRSAAKQKAVVTAKIGSNTTLIGVGNDAKIIHGGLIVADAENVIIRNIHFEDAYDFFPAWDPKDNSHGEWNAEYDNLTLHNASNIWIDHCTFSDGKRPDKMAQTALGRPIQHHDGLLDIIRGSTYVTVSHNVFKNHDKGILVGNSDSLSSDAGKLKVTFRHNLFENVSERSPRVRFGQVHIVNNVYRSSAGADYTMGYSIGVGINSRVIAENNLWLVPPSATAGNLVRVYKGTHLLDQGSAFNGQAVSLGASHPALKTDVGWTPVLAQAPSAAAALEKLVVQNAGTGKVMVALPTTR